MAVPIKIQIKGLKELRTVFKKSPEIVRDQLQRAITLSTALVSRKAKLEAPVGVSGHLKSRIRIRISPFRGIIEPTVKYGLYVHKGTRPHWTGVGNLRKWAKRKGINPYALQKSIAKKGTKANPFMKRAAKKSESKVQAIFQRAINNITKQLTV